MTPAAVSPTPATSSVGKPRPAWVRGHQLDGCAVLDFMRTGAAFAKRILRCTGGRWQPRRPQGEKRMHEQPLSAAGRPRRRGAVSAPLKFTRLLDRRGSATAPSTAACASKGPVRRLWHPTGMGGPAVEATLAAEALAARMGQSRHGPKAPVVPALGAEATAGHQGAQSRPCPERSGSWRRRRDSNPRCRFCPHTPLAGEHLRPLGHVSGVR